jgi:predicted GIY-YIG superfamily endonuclease
MTGSFADYESVTIEQPTAKFKDVTHPARKLRRSISELRLADLAETLTEHLVPTVRCPWGCTEFYHKSVQFDLMTVMLRYLGPELKVIGTLKDVNIKSSREDYFDSIDYLMMNPRWKISPSVAFSVEGYPHVLVCRDHKKGSRLNYVHPPRSPNGILPTRRSDQNAHAVVVPRTISPMKAKSYSNTFQMHEMRGSFVGMDTISLVDHGRFDFQSTLSRENEVLACAGRTDTRGLLSRHAANGIIPAWLAEDYMDDAHLLLDMQEVAGTVRDGSEWKDCCKGATFVSYTDAIRMQKTLNDNGMKECIVSDDARVMDDLQFQPDDEVRLVQIRPVWVSEIVVAHPVDGHGAMFTRIPRYNVTNVDTSCLWLMISMLTTQPRLWKGTVDSVRCTSEWLGWVLARATKDCFHCHKGKQSKKNPFQLNTTMKSVNERLVGVDGAGYHWQSFMAKFNTIRAIDAVSSESFFETSIDTMEFEGDAVVVCRSDYDTHDELPESIVQQSSDDVWELRYVAVTRAGNHPHLWCGKCFVRHGTTQFPKWWSQDRRWKGFVKCESARLAHSDTTGWSVAVYVKNESGQLAKLRDEYLGYIGGQPNNYCALHDKPLIAAVNKKGDPTACTCGSEGANQVCGSRGYLRCGEAGCPVVVCREHAITTNGDKTSFSVMEDNSAIDGSGGAAGLNDGGGAGTDGAHHASSMQIDGDDVVVHETMLLAQRHIRHAESYSDEDSEESHDGVVENVVNDNESVNDNVFLQAQLDPDMDLTHAVVIDDEVDEMDVDADDGTMESDYNFHATNAGRRTIPIWCAKTYISSHVVLNGVGSCLIRRNRPLNPTRAQSAFLEKLVSTSEGHSVPLVYPEGMMFPSIFWKDTSDGSLLGAIPSSLLTDSKQCAKQGFASLTDHMRCRMKNPSLRTSSDPRHIYHAFDCFTNVNLRGQDSRLVLSRGFVESDNGGGVCANSSDWFNTDAIDSRPVVNKLGAAIAVKKADLFYTQSVNQKEFYGLKQLKQWLDSNEFKERLLDTKPNATNDELVEMIDAATQAACVHFVRNWMEVAEIHMHYIAKSPEFPLGKVEKIWWRHEFQGEAGNLSHIHCLLWIEDCDGKEEMLADKVRGSIADLIRPEEIQPLIDEGFFSSLDDILSIRDYARRVLTHRCDSRCMRRTGPGENDLKCRFPASIALNPVYTDHSMVSIEPRHSNDALDVMKKLDLCHEDSTTDKFIATDPRFRCERFYPSSMPAEGKISPTNGRLFAYTLSSCNVQITSYYFSCRYLAKYVAGLDEGTAVYAAPKTDMRAGEREQVTPELVLHSEYYHAPKVTGSKINIEKREKKLKHGKYPKGRALALTEVITRALGYNQVYTNMDFEMISTTTMAERPGFDRTAPGWRDPAVQASQGPSDLIPGDHIASVAARERWQLPQWRYLRQSEQTLLLDQLYCPVTVDKTTVFGIRPPELRFVQSQGLYYKWFVRSPSVKGDKAVELQMNSVARRAQNTKWVDGMNSVVRVRLSALRELVAYSQGKAERELSTLMTSFERYCLRTPNSAFQRERAEWLMTTFVFDDGKKPLPVIVYSNIKPTRPHNFLLHVVLSMGSFCNELELYGGSSDYRDIFTVAGLYDPSDPEGSTLSTIKRYVQEQLLYVPGGTKMFDRLLVACYTVLYETLVEGRTPLLELPSVLYTSLRQVTSDNIKNYIDERRLVLATVTVDDLKRDAAHRGVLAAATIAECTKQTVLQPPLAFGRASVQSQLSYDEQQRGFVIATEKLMRYANASPTMVKSLCIVGGPGAGKTALLRMILLKSMSLGLTTTLTAIMSERALQLGGVHVHKLFMLPVREKGTVQRMAELALQSLYKCPERQALLLATDVFIADEFGQFSDILISILDIVLRTLRNSSAFMGGSLWIVTMDWKQLKPIEGLPAMLSPFMVTCFSFHELNHSVRAGRDSALQRIQQIARLSSNEYTPEVLNEFRLLIANTCTFVSSWDSPVIGKSTVRVFGRHEAVRLAEKEMISSIKNSDVTVVQSEARDEEMSVTAHSNWITATESTRRRLDRKCKEARILTFYPSAVYEMTENCPGKFSQSQVAVLGSMPTAEQARTHGAVTLLLAPPGCKAVPENVNTPEGLLHCGWEEMTVGEVKQPRVHTFSQGIRGRRLQYAFRHRIAATVHATLGCDFEKLATSVSTTDSRYRLWEKEQVVVLLSRTFLGRNLIFVGDKGDTIEALVALITKRSQYSDYITHLLGVLCGRNASGNALAAPVIRNHLMPFRPIDVMLPQDGTGFCYIIVSLQDRSTTYIGQTLSLVRRLNEHNRGTGSNQTASPLKRPWSLVAFVCGFDGDKSRMRRFEMHWERRCQELMRTGQISSAAENADVARNVIIQWQQNGDGAELRYVLAGTFH